MAAGVFTTAEEIDTESWKLRERFGRLYNTVHAENTLAVRWLRRMGFVLHEPHAHPDTGEMFHYFEMN